MSLLDDSTGERPGQWGDIRTGTLREAEAVDLAADLLVADYPRLEGVHHGSILHGAPISFHDGGACAGEGAPPELTSAADFGDEWVKDLWARGQPTEAGGVRVVGSRGNWFYRYLPFEDPTGELVGYRAYVRDALPFEDERGIVVAPPLPGERRGAAGSP